jgi:hypothetical protein
MALTGLKAGKGLSAAKAAAVFSKTPFPDTNRKHQESISASEFSSGVKIMGFEIRDSRFRNQEAAIRCQQSSIRNLESKISNLESFSKENSWNSILREENSCKPD